MPINFRVSKPEIFELQDLKPCQQSFTNYFFQIADALSDINQSIFCQFLSLFLQRFRRVMMAHS